MASQTLTQTLRDQNADHDTRIALSIASDDHSVAIEAEGFNNCTTDDGEAGDGHKSIIYLEVWEGKLRCLVWGNINQEDPTHIIDLSEALIANRNCHYCQGNCARDPEHACDGYLGDVDNLYGTKKGDRDG